MTPENKGIIKIIVALEQSRNGPQNHLAATFRRHVREDGFDKIIKVVGVNFHSRPLTNAADERAAPNSTTRDNVPRSHTSDFGKAKGFATFLAHLDGAHYVVTRAADQELVSSHLAQRNNRAAKVITFDPAEIRGKTEKFAIDTIRDIRMGRLK